MLEEEVAGAWLRARKEATDRLPTHNFDVTLEKLFEAYRRQPRFRALHEAEIERNLEIMQQLGYSDNCVEFYAIVYRIIKEEENG